MLILGGMLTAAHADTWVMRDTLRRNGHERSMAAKRADARKCGAAQGGRSFNDTAAPNMQQCMLARGWVLDHIVPDPPSRHAAFDDDSAPAGRQFLQSTTGSDGSRTRTISSRCSTPSR